MEVIKPPKDEQKFAEVSKWIINGAIELGIDIDPEGFLYSWVDGTRVIVDLEGPDKIVGMVLMRAGLRWVDSTHKATILRIKGRDEGRLMEFAITIAKAVGSSGLIYEETTPIEETGDYIRYAVRELKLS